MISFSAFSHELTKIAEEGFVPLSTPQPAPTVSSFNDDHDRKKRHIGSDGGIPSKQLEKKADAKSALIGAGIGAGLSGYRTGMSEWDRRIKEDETPSLSAEERTRRRKQRLHRLAATVATGAGAGAIGGHFVGKGVHALTSHATEAGKGLAEHGARVIEEGTVRAGRQLGRDAAEAAKSPAKKGWKLLNTDVRDLGKSGPVRHKSHPFARKVKVSSGSLRSLR